MAEKFNVFRGQVLEDHSAVIQGRVVDKYKNLYAQADLASISYRVVLIETDEDGVRTGTQVVASTALTIADVILDTPFDWDVSQDKANFRHVIDDDVFTEGNAEYQVQYTFTGNDGTVGGGLVELETVEVL